MVVKVSEAEADEVIPQSQEIVDDPSHELTEIENTYDLKVIELKRKNRSF